jgi:hypothetical protein
MNDKMERYITTILENMVVDEKLKERVAQDLRGHINEASQKKSMDEVLDKMGSPDEVAREFMDTIYQDKNEVIERMIQERLKLNQLFKDAYYEFKTKIKLFGLPLIHIKFRRLRGYGTKYGAAKGIIAIGDIAIGVIAFGQYAYGGLCIGGYSLGVISIGGFSAGLISLGGFCIGLASFGGVGAGIWSLGGFSAGLYTLGGAIAIGVNAVSGIAAFSLNTHGHPSPYGGELSPLVASVTIALIMIYLFLFIRFMIRRIRRIDK